MPTYKAKGLIIKSYRLGETDKIIKIFTPDDGLISAVAKGAFNIKSKFSGRLELYNIVDGEFSLGKNLDIISQAEVLEIFENISNDFLKFNYLQLISELILKTQTERVPSYNLFKLTYLIIKRINDIEYGDELPLQVLIIFYMINFLKITGHAPMLESCTVCGRDFFEKVNERKGSIVQIINANHPAVNDKNICSSSAYFSVSFGGLVCRSCSSGLANIKFLNKEKANFLKKLHRARIEELKNQEVTAETVSDLLELMLQYVSFHSDITLASFAYLKKIHKNFI